MIKVTNKPRNEFSAIQTKIHSEVNLSRRSPTVKQIFLNVVCHICGYNETDVCCMIRFR